MTVLSGSVAALFVRRRGVEEMYLPKLLLPTACLVPGHSTAVNKSCASQLSKHSALSDPPDCVLLCLSQAETPVSSLLRISGSQHSIRVYNNAGSLGLIGVKWYSERLLV